MTVSRCRYIDIAKGLCIILVVVGHFNPEYAPYWWKLVNRIIYTFHMPVFLFASGFIFIHTRKTGFTYSGMLRNKVKRLLIPYVSTSVIVITIKLLTQGSMTVDNPVTPLSYLRIFCYPEAGYFLWFIWTLWWMFMAAGLCRRKKTLWILTLVTLILHFLPFRATGLFAIEATRYNAIYFMTGVMTCVYRERLRVLRQIPQMAFYAGFIMLEAAYVIIPEATAWHYIAANLIPFAGIAAVIALSCSVTEIDRRRTAWIYSVAASSYMIYLFHTTFEGFTKSVAVKAVGFQTSGLEFTVVALVVIAAGLYGPMLLQKYLLEKWRLSRFLFGLKKTVRENS